MAKAVSVQLIKCYKTAQKNNLIQKKLQKKSDTEFQNFVANFKVVY